MYKNVFSPLRKIALISFFIFIISAQTVAAKSYEVGTDSLNIRSGPSMSANVIDHITSGTTIENVDEKYGWVKFNSNGTVGWVASQFLLENGTSQMTNEQQTYQIIVNHLNVRSQPSLSSTVVGTFNYGEKITGQTIHNGWVQTSLNGQEVFVAADYLSDSSKATATTVNTASTQVVKPQNNLTGKTIMIDVGHGGIDPGSIALDHSYEKNLTLRVSEAVSSQLSALGANVIVSRSDDNTISLVERAQLSQDLQPDAFVSLHYNAHVTPESNGISTHFSNSNGSEQLAQNIQNALTQQTAFADRGVRQNNYYVLTYNDSPAALVELGFITNPYDLNLITSQDHPNSIARAISDGIISFLY